MLIILLHPSKFGLSSVADLWNIEQKLQTQQKVYHVYPRKCGLHV